MGAVFFIFTMSLVTDVLLGVTEFGFAHTDLMLLGIQAMEDFVKSKKLHKYTRESCSCGVARLHAFCGSLWTSCTGTCCSPLSDPNTGCIHSIPDLFRENVNITCRLQDWSMVLLVRNGLLSKHFIGQSSRWGAALQLVGLNVCQHRLQPWDMEIMPQPRNGDVLLCKFAALSVALNMAISIAWSPITNWVLPAHSSYCLVVGPLLPSWQVL